MSGYETARIADIERSDGWSPIRRFFEIRSFGVNAWTGKEAGTAVIPDHDEEPTGHEELYLVFAGHAKFTVEGEEIDAPAGARAIHCATAVRDALADIGLEVRAGLHTGECEILDGKVSGIAVAIGARVAARAASGQVIVSQTVKDLVAGSGITFDETEVVQLKGVPGEWRLYAVGEPV